MSRRWIIHLIAIMVAFTLEMVIRRKWYPEVQLWKMLVMLVWASVTGIFSIKLLYFIENGKFGGDAFFGLVLFMPIFMIPMVLLRISYKMVMNIYAPAQALTFVFGKIECYLNNCCVGKYLPSLGIQFPSQIADMIVGIGVTSALVWIGHKRPKAHLYPWLMVIYGSARFVVDWFRYVPKPWKWILPPTIIYSLLSVAIGIAWLIILKRNQHRVELQQSVE